MSGSSEVQREPSALNHYNAVETQCSGLALEGIRKTYASAMALDGVSFCVPKGSIVAVLGPSQA